MKKFIVFIITAIILAVSTTINADAQKISNDYEFETIFSTFEDSIYKDYLATEYDYGIHQEKVGRDLMIIGGTSMLLGGASLAIAYTGITDTGTYREVDNFVAPLALSGYILMIAGELTFDVGVYKFVRGRTTQREIKLNVVPMGLKVSF